MAVESEKAEVRSTLFENGFSDEDVVEVYRNEEEGCIEVQFVKSKEYSNCLSALEDLAEEGMGVTVVNEEENSFRVY